MAKLGYSRRKALKKNPGCRNEPVRKVFKCKLFTCDVTCHTQSSHRNASFTENIFVNHKETALAKCFAHFFYGKSVVLTFFALLIRDRMRSLTFCVLSLWKCICASVGPNDRLDASGQPSSNSGGSSSDIMGK